MEPQHKGIMAGIGIVSYIDNDAARFALISGVSKKDVAGLIVEEVACVESELGIAPWFGRVGTESNLADEPSKLLGSSFILLVGRSLQLPQQKQPPSCSEEAVNSLLV